MKLLTNRFESTIDLGFGLVGVCFVLLVYFVWLVLVVFFGLFCFVLFFICSTHWLPASWQLLSKSCTWIWINKFYEKFSKKIHNGIKFEVNTTVLAIYRWVSMTWNTNDTCLHLWCLSMISSRNLGFKSVAKHGIQWYFI